MNQMNQIENPVKGRTTFCKVTGTYYDRELFFYI